VINAARIAPIRHRSGKPCAHPELAFRLPQQQQAAVRRLVAAVEIMPSTGFRSRCGVRFNLNGTDPVRRRLMNGVIYIIGLVVVVLFILSFLGLR
jgi:hypothetical protein